jgi:hypothetical protein
VARSAQRAAAPLGWSLAAFLVAFSLIVELFAAAAPTALSAPAFARADDAAIAAELKALFGDTAELCVHINDPGSPGKRAPCRHCSDQCLLCRIGAQAAQFIPLAAPMLPTLASAGRHTIGAERQFSAHSVWLAESNRARGPPLAD